MSTIDDLVEDEYLDLLSVECVALPGFPDFRFELPSATRDLDRYENFVRLWKDNLYHIAALPDASYIGFCNKLKPHAIFDTMLIQSDRDVRSNVSDLTPQQRRFLFLTANSFVQHAADRRVTEKFDLNGARIHIVYNSAATTEDRENSMGYSKRFHLHLNCWPDWQMESLRIKQLKSTPSVSKRRDLLDPLTPLGGRLIRHLIAQENLFPKDHLFSDSAEERIQSKLPAGCVVALHEGWESLLATEFGEDVSRLDKAMTQQYANLQEAFTGKSHPARAWTRHKLRPVKIIQAEIRALGYPREICTGLCHLAQTLHTASPQLLEHFRRRKNLRIRHMSMNGLNYSLGFFAGQPHDSKRPIIGAADVYMVIQPKFLSPVGGASVIYNDLASMIALHRNRRSFTEYEMEMRNAFQQSFLQWTLAFTRPTFGDLGEVSGPMGD